MSENNWEGNFDHGDPRCGDPMCGEPVNDRNS